MSWLAHPEGSNRRIARADSERETEELYKVSIEMKRRTFLYSGLALGLGETVSPASCSQSAILTPEMFGARANGDDDYDALLALAKFCSGRRHIRVRFARDAHYRINRFKIEGGPRANGVTDILFDGLQDFEIDLNGSTVEVEGRFFRNRDFEGFPYSWTNSVTPFAFRNCARGAVRNGRCIGNVRHTSRELKPNGSGIDSNCYGFSILGCEDFLVEDVESSAFPGDGFFISATTATSGTSTVSKNVSLQSCVAEFNARQGLTITAARNVDVIGGRYSYTGYIEMNSSGGPVAGPYGAQSPSAGVDIEPDAPNPDAKTGDIRFRDVTFEENAGFQFVCSTISDGAEGTGHVSLINCRFRRRDLAGSVSFGADRVDIVDSEFENVGIWPLHGGANLDFNRMTGSIRGNRLTSNIPDVRLLAIGDNGGSGSPHLDVVNNVFEIYGGLGPANYIPIRVDLAPNISFTDNLIRVNASANSAAHSPRSRFVVARVGSGVSSNAWKSDAANNALVIEFRTARHGGLRRADERLSPAFAAIDLASGHRHDTRGRYILRN
ncbi:hypothetical protein [Brevundimonas kwangchunensis]|uniref:hypothetical protein n=1 Tax=Brevundimonas kwangchunensis TaxID=322163 RepID=UPI0031D2B13A